jgi:methylated-DNA-[protein]-cysteine S-methyltransferase
MTDAYAIAPSPIGPLLLGARGGSLTLLYTSHFPDHTLGAEHPGDAAVLAQTERQLGRYFAGELADFDVPLAPEGTEFQRRVWSELCRIPFGETISYGELARRVDRPGSARAVGHANGRNPISIIVPCHRVIGGNGKLTGYGGGLPRKAWLLDHEARFGPGQLALEPADLVAIS